MDTITIVAIILIACLAAVCLILYFCFSKKAKQMQEEIDIRQSEMEISDREHGKQVEEFKNTITQLEENIASFKDNANSLESQISSLQSDLKCKEGQVSSLKKDLATYQDAENVIKALNLKIEEAEEDLRDSEKNVRKIKTLLDEKSSENSSLQQELRQAAVYAEQLKDSLREETEKLDAASQKLSETEDALEFIQELLSAEPTNDHSLIVKWNRIDEIASFISSDLQDFVKEHFKSDVWSEFIFGQGVKQWEATSRKEWIVGKKTIAFIGEFSAGKTSIVNRILSQDSSDALLLPVSPKATTAIPTYITGGENSSYQFVSPDGTLKQIREATFKKVSREILERINGTASLIKYFVMTYRNPFLNGMSILDTPGFNSDDKKDAERTIDVINECDALFWVFDVNAGTINRSSLDVIKHNMTRPLYVIINKVDTKDESDVDKVEQLIRTSFEEENIKVKGYLRFSSKYPISELMDTISNISKDDAPQRYISTLTSKYIPSLIQICEENFKKSSALLDSSYKKCDTKLSGIVALCSTIQKDSTTAAGIPHWETHFIGKDRYEMDKNEGKKLVKLLDKVAYTDIVSLSDQVSEYGSLMQENQKRYAEKNKYSQELQKINGFYEKLSRLIKKLDD